MYRTCPPHDLLPYVVHMYIMVVCRAAVLNQLHNIYIYLAQSKDVQRNFND